MENKSYKEILEDIEKWESVKLKNQGRSKKQIEGNYKMLWWTMIGASALILISNFIINLLMVVNYRWLFINSLK